MKLRIRSRATAVAWLVVVAGSSFAHPSAAEAFWLLGFGGAKTLPPRAVGVIAGTGAQATSVGSPAKTSETFQIPHAGIRVGVGRRVDIGYRLTQVALPFSNAGPSLGSELDVKYQVTKPSSSTSLAVVGGFAYSYVQTLGQSKVALSPGVDLIGSRSISKKTVAFAELRGVQTTVPTAPGGAAHTYVNAFGIGTGVSVALSSSVSLIPEIGVFRLTGELARNPANGAAVQAGVVLGIRVK